MTLNEVVIDCLKTAEVDPYTIAALSGLGTAGTMAIPGMIGAATSPKGHRYEGAMRGMGRFGGGLSGALLGGMAGGAGGAALTKGEPGVGAAIGGIGGAIGGGLLGDQAAQWLMGGGPSWERSKEDVNRLEHSPIRTTVSRVMGGLPSMLNPEVAGATNSGDDPKIHSQQVNHGSGRALAMGGGAIAAAAIANLLAARFGAPAAAQPLIGMGAGLAGGLGGYGLSGLMMDDYPERKKR